MNEKFNELLRATAEERGKWLQGGWEQIQPPLDPGVASGIATEAVAEAAAQAHAARVKAIAEGVRQGKMVGIGTPKSSGNSLFATGRYPVFDEPANEPLPPKPAPFEGDILTRLYKTLQGDKQEPNLYFVVADGVCRMITPDEDQARSYHDRIVDGMDGQADPFADAEPVVNVTLYDRQQGCLHTTEWDTIRSKIVKSKIVSKPNTYPLEA